MTSVDQPLSPETQDVVEFVRGHELFHGLEPREVEEISARVEVEHFPPRAVILSPDEQAAGTIRLVRSGAVDLVDEGRALDRLGEGELFGHPSMLSGLPPGFEVRAAEDTTCFRLDRADALRVLGRSSGLRYVVCSLLGRPPRAGAPLVTVDPTRQRVDQLTREPAIVCGPDISVREAVRLMVEKPASCVLVRGETELLGIVTDRDLRSRVLAADTPVAEIMSSPVVTAPPEQCAADATLAMLDRGIRHLPIVAARGEIVGVLREVDLLAAQAHTPFVLRSAIAAAHDLDALRRAATRLEGTVIALHDAGMDAAQISGVISTVTDAVTRRLLELAGGTSPELAWLALGSHGRREAMPASDLDSAVAWGGEPDQADAVGEVTSEVVAGLAACGVHSDPHGAVATNRLFMHTTAEWERRVRKLVADPRGGKLVADPRGEKTMILVSLVCDGRMVTGRESLPDPFAALESAPGRPLLLRLLLRVGLAPRPPTGFLRDVVVEQSGEHRGRFDIKRGGLLPLVNLVRFGAVAAGARVTGTAERLRIAADAGTLPRETAGSLEDAFDLLTALRLDHQVELLRAGKPADDFLDPRTLNPLARRYLRDAFRAIASIQRTLANELAFDSGTPQWR